MTVFPAASVSPEVATSRDDTGPRGAGLEAETGLALPVRPAPVQALQAGLDEAGGLPALVEGGYRWLIGQPAVATALLQSAGALGLDPGGRRATWGQAVHRFGGERAAALLTALTLVVVLPVEADGPDRFRTFALQRARLMAWLARRHGDVEPDVALVCGLYGEAGVALMLQRFHAPSYRATLAEVNLGHRPCLDIEQWRHGIDHAALGAQIAQHWEAPADVVEAVHHHHDYVWLGRQPARRQGLLVALGLLAERMIRQPPGRQRHAEWVRGGALALQALDVAPEEAQAWNDEIDARRALD
jgi:HD-like signal output (HDOD) protein